MLSTQCRETRSTQMRHGSQNRGRERTLCVNRILSDEAAIGWYSSAPWNYTSGKVGEGGGFGVEGRDGFDEARDGEGVADAAGSADQAEHAAFTRKLDGDAH